jgi:hypothetical protein
MTLPSFPDRPACNNPQSSLDIGTTLCRRPFARLAKTRTPLAKTLSHVNEVISPHRYQSSPQPMNERRQRPAVIGQFRALPVGNLPPVRSGGSEQ